MYTGWQLSNNEKQKLLEKFPPKYERVIAHHITYALGKQKSLPPKIEEAFVIGYCAEDGVEALVIMVNGSTYRTVIGGLYHITWSLEKSRKPRDSNVLLQRYAYTFIDPIPLTELTERQF